MSLISVPKTVAAHAVGLVADHQIPLRGGLQLLLDVLIPGELVHAGDQVVLVVERVGGAGGLDHVAGENLEVQAELLVQLVLPLLGERAGRDDQAALQVAADHQLLDEQPGHDGLARARDRRRAGNAWAGGAASLRRRRRSGAAAAR